jgi:hypothetical protein
MSQTSRDLADAQLRRELAAYEAALASALAQEAFEALDQLSDRLERLRDEMRRDDL